MAENAAMANLPTDNRAPVIIGVVSFLLTLTTVFVGMRLYIRHRMTNSLWWDDWTMLLALVGVFYDRWTSPWRRSDRLFKLLTVITGVDMCIMVRTGMGFHIWTLTPQQINDYAFVSTRPAPTPFLPRVANSSLGVLRQHCLLQCRAQRDQDQPPVAVLPHLFFKDEEDHYLLHGDNRHVGLGSDSHICIQLSTNIRILG